MIQVIIADDHELVRTGVRLMLSNTTDIKVIGEASNGEEAIILVKDKNPDVLLLDVSMPGIGGIEAAKRILTANKKIKIIMLSAYCQDPLPYNILKLGVLGYLTKGVSIEELVKAIHRVALGHKYLDPEIARQLALRNVSNFEASTLTVNTYRYRIFEKLKIRNDVELTLLIIRYGILDFNEL